MLELTQLERDDGAVDDTVTLPFDLRQRSRLRVMLDGGGEAGVLLAPGSRMLEGDALLAPDGTRVGVRAANEDVSTGHASEPLLLARACYHLGNRHVPLQIGDGWVRYQPDHVLDGLLAGLGVEVIRECVAFQPEAGAYGGEHATGHSHDHEHDHNHGRTDGHSH